MNNNLVSHFAKKLFSHKPSSEPARHARRAFQKPKSFSLSMTVLVFTLFFLFLPLIVVVIMSFSSDGVSLNKLSLVWYEKLFTDSSSLWMSFFNSIIVAVSSSIVATVLGTLAAIGVSWYRFKGKQAIHTLTFLPMILPEVIMGVSMLLFFSALNIRGSLFTVTVAHVTFNLPFVFLLVMARLEEFDYSIIEAAHDLGATERQTMTKVVIPAIMPGIISGFLMAITMSLDDYVITYLLAGKGTATLPIYVYNTVRYGVSPVVNALSFIIILATMLLAFSLRKFLKNIAAAK